MAKKTLNNRQYFTIALVACAIIFVLALVIGQITKQIKADTLPSEEPHLPDVSIQSGLE